MNLNEALHPTACQLTEYYDVLGCGPHSTHDQIHAEYRHLALQFHPDKKLTAKRDNWNQIREAYEVLGDPQRRAQYDRWRASRLPVPFDQWLRSSHAHAVHWSFDYQKRAIEMTPPANNGWRCSSAQLPDNDIYAKFRNYEI
ncbi:DnaJ sub C member 12 [Coemansia aciculifera]|uniref:DnaJ sub C member 12 n=1 Tax=Coemansia pectinata TaxID=1052879 RepID=A0A9W8GYM9_9FUNG|nr:DnaJ sub C member 12 [Coemansia pectinata]KAJ2880024.1 DnaJ sub C member 12 [Coemansia aciculifera]